MVMTNYNLLTLKFYYFRFDHL